MNKSLTNRRRVVKVQPKGYNSGASVSHGRKEDYESHVVHVTGSLCDDHGTWTVRARFKDETSGKTWQKTKSTKLKVKANTKRKATAMMNELLRQWEDEANAPVEEEVHQLTFCEVAEEYLENKKIRVRESTYLNNTYHYNQYIKGFFGDILIADVSRQFLQGFVNQLAETYAASTVHSILKIVNCTLEYAVKDDLIQKNPLKYVDKPANGKSPGKAYTEEQVFDLIECAKHVTEPYLTAVILACFYGLRREEVCGLRWSDINFDNNTMYICNTVASVNGTVIEQEMTKTQSSTRTLFLIDSTVDYLRALKQSHIDRGFKLDKVCLKRNGEAINPRYLSMLHSRTLKRFGLEHIRFHDLRHTAASLLARRASPKQVQHFLGHSNISTTMNIYTHLSLEDRMASSELMNGMISETGVSF